MNRKLLLVAGIATAAIALAVLQSWQSSVIEDYSPGKEVAVIVAATGIGADTRVRGNMFERVKLSEHLVRRVPHAVTPELLPTVEGQRLARKLKPGEILSMTDFGDEMRAGSLAQRIPKTMRAVPFPVDELNAFSGLIQPGDSVDILAYMTHPDTGKEVITSFLDDVQVLATGERMTPGSGFGRGGTVTLMLDRNNAAQLSLAQRSGELVFLLRHPEDGEPVANVDELDADSLLTPVVKEVRVTRPKARVRVLSASSTGS